MTKTEILKNQQKESFDLIFKTFCFNQVLRNRENARAVKGDDKAVMTVIKNDKVASYINSNQLSLLNLFKNYSFTQNYIFKHSTLGRGKTYEAINNAGKTTKRVFVSNFTVVGLFVNGVFYRSNFKYGTTTSKQITIYQRDNLKLKDYDTKHIKKVSNEELFDLLKKHNVIKDGAYNYDTTALASKYPNYQELLCVKYSA